MSPSARIATVVVVGLLALAACGGDGTGSDAGQGAGGSEATAQRASGEPTSTTTEGPTTTGPPTTGAATAAEAPVVISAGDSIIYDVSPVLVEALHPDVARVIPVVAPSAENASAATLHELVVTEEADLTILMVGVWERVHVTAGGHELGDAGFAEEYRAEALDPLRDAAARVGGEVLLAGPPHLRDRTAEAQVNELEAIWRTYAAETPNVRFADTDAWLGGYAEFAEVTPQDEGPTARLRRIDGIHLCVEGARRIAAGLIEAMSGLLAGPPHPGWQQGAWRSEFPADECPPVP